MEANNTRTLDIEAKHEHDFRRTILIVDDEPVNLRLGSLTPQIAETQYWVIFLRKFQNLVYRNAVL